MGSSTVKPRLPARITVATDRDLNYVISLQRRFADQLGFLTKQTIVEYIGRNQIWIEHENDQPCGYLIFATHKCRPQFVRDPTTLRIYQTAIQLDAQRELHGTSITKALQKYAQRLKFRRIHLWCASDLPAIKFWNDIGYTPTAIRIGGERRQRIHTAFTLELGREDATS